MRQRVITGIVFILSVLAFVIPSYWFSPLMLLFGIIVGSISIYELIKAFTAGGFKPNSFLVAIGGVIAVIIALISYFQGTGILVALSLYLLIVVPYCLACVILPSVIDKENHLAGGAVTAMIVLYVTFPLFCLASLSMLVPSGWFYMVPALMAAWISDTCAYFVGVTMGKHKIVPHLSPKKTWEGCIGGAVGCATLIMIYFGFLYMMEVGDYTVNTAVFCSLAFILGFAMSVMSQLGDWLASLIKRMCGIKDYGNLFPGHGGMLDRFDSAFFTIPMGVLLAIIAYLLTDIM